MKIPIVNENDEIICYKERDEIKQTDLYRVSALWLTNSVGEVLLARRALDKKNDPGKWGPAVAGTNEEGETYKQNIVKEVKEELGLEIKCKKSIKILRNSLEREHNYFTQWFVAEMDVDAKDIVFDKVEVAQVKWFSKEELFKKVKTNPGEFLASIREYIGGEVKFE